MGQIRHRVDVGCSPRSIGYSDRSYKYTLDIFIEISVVCLFPRLPLSPERYVYVYPPTFLYYPSKITYHLYMYVCMYQATMYNNEQTFTSYNYDIFSLTQNITKIIALALLQSTL